ncbi:MAG: hypothetical protein K2Z80_37170 [Xanthobacteraceae bacterium]|nr:hypothetical protein [Xanthobacteraceae bacterium]
MITVVRAIIAGLRAAFRPAPLPARPPQADTAANVAAWIDSLKSNVDWEAVHRREARCVVSWAVERAERDWQWLEPPPATAKVTRAWLQQLDAIELAAIVLASTACMADHFAGKRFIGLPPRNETDFEGFRRRFASERAAIRDEWDDHLARKWAAAGRARAEGERRGRGSSGGPKFRRRP